MALVLRRKLGEKIVIGSTIEICVIETHESSVKLAITAPDSVKILRKELELEKQHEECEPTTPRID
mgnify:CR=1 FL=1